MFRKLCFVLTRKDVQAVRSKTSIDQVTQHTLTEKNLIIISLPVSLEAFVGIGGDVIAALRGQMEIIPSTNFLD